MQEQITLRRASQVQGDLRNAVELMRDFRGGRASFNELMVALVSPFNSDLDGASPDHGLLSGRQDAAIPKGRATCTEKGEIVRERVAARDSGAALTRSLPQASEAS